MMEFEQVIPAMAKAITMAGSMAMTTDMWESQYSAPVVVLMPVIAKC
jgi:hypothetical protein